ncbi:MAG TPA: hypothetical protein PLL95_07770 [Anaerolineales bacterium]|nr:hypothetical protein [Anaerolineales bacterium]
MKNIGYYLCTCESVQACMEHARRPALAAVLCQKVDSGKNYF